MFFCFCSKIQQTYIKIKKTQSTSFPHQLWRSSATIITTKTVGSTSFVCRNSRFTIGALHCWTFQRCHENKKKEFYDEMREEKKKSKFLDGTRLKLIKRRSLIGGRISNMMKIYEFDDKNRVRFNFITNCSVYKNLPNQAKLEQSDSGYVAKWEPHRIKTLIDIIIKALEFLFVSCFTNLILFAQLTKCRSASRLFNQWLDTSKFLESLISFLHTFNEQTAEFRAEQSILSLTWTCCS